MAVYKVYKKLGETPLECLERIRNEKNIDLSVSMTYAGRLDPAAMGEMLIITGEDIKNKEDYLHKDKIYEVEYIIGISTDTGDLLGIVNNISLKESININQDKIQEILINLSGKRLQAFHAFSSKPYKSRPMWEHAKQGNIINEHHLVDIYRLELLNIDNISINDIFTRVESITQAVNADFRQKQIIDSWQEIKNINVTLPILKIYANVSTGTYMRVLGEEIGFILGLPVCAYSIVRKEIIL